MIVDIIEQIGSYCQLDRRIVFALQYIKTTNFGVMSPGRYEIDGDNMFAIVNDYTTVNSRECKLEAHRKYIDVQYMVRGTEWFGYAPRREREPASPYSEEQDLALYDKEASFIKFEEGMFAIFFPDDLHMPGTDEKPGEVRKVVVKIKI